MNRTAARTIATVCVVLLIVVGCGDDETSATSTTTTAAPAETTTSTTAAPAPQLTDVSVYFFSGESLAVGYGRTAEGLGVAATAVEALLAGPSADDEALGLSSAIPPGVELLGLNIVDTLATVDLSADFGSGGGSQSMNGRVAQVVYTITQFPSVRGVRINIDGEADTALGGEGLSLDHTFTRADFEFGGSHEHLAPAILVESPRPGDEVGSSFEVTGRANTFEATVNLEVVDTAGNVVVDDLFTTATSGTGTPGDFAATISLPSGGPVEIVLVVFEGSAQDGDPINVVEVPLSVVSASGSP